MPESYNVVGLRRRLSGASSTFRNFFKWHVRWTNPNELWRHTVWTFIFMGKEEDEQALALATHEPISVLHVSAGFRVVRESGRNLRASASLSITVISSEEGRASWSEAQNPVSQLIFKTVIHHTRPLKTKQ